MLSGPLRVLLVFWLVGLALTCGLAQNGPWPRSDRTLSRPSVPAWLTGRNMVTSNRAASVVPPPAGPVTFAHEPETPDPGVEESGLPVGTAPPGSHPIRSPGLYVSVLMSEKINPPEYSKRT